MKSTSGICEMFDLFTDEAVARQRLESIRWAEGILCPHCQSQDICKSAARQGFYDCRECRARFNVCTGTVFEKSHVELRKWIHSIYLLMTAQKGVSSLQLSKEIGVTQKAAWSMLSRLRLACSNDMEQLCAVGGNGEIRAGTKTKEQKKHTRKRSNNGRGKRASTAKTSHTDMAAMRHKTGKDTTRARLAQ